MLKHNVLPLISNEQETKILNSGRERVMYIFGESVMKPIYYRGIRFVDMDEWAIKMVGNFTGTLNHVCDDDPNSCFESI